MTARLKKDESGMAMALTVIMIALLSVMGAGLLVFATTDLNTVVESNRGQRAFEMADAGVQAAKKQLTSDSEADHYNGGTGDIEWSYNSPSPTTDGVTLSNLDPATTTSHSVNVTIEYRSATTDFKVVSTGSYGDSRRRIEAIFKSVSDPATGGTSVPQMVYTPGGSETRGFTLNGISMYTGGSLDFANANNVTLNKASIFSGGNILLNYYSTTFVRSGTDPYEDWNRPPYNTTARSTSSPGIAAVGEIRDKYNTTLYGPNVSGSRGTWAFDKNTTPKFVATPSSPQTSGQITFPFDESNMETKVDTLVAELKTVAQNQGRYLEVNGSSNPEFRISNCGPGDAGCGADVDYKWPAATASVPWPVVYVKFNGGSAGSGTNGNRVRWSVPGTSCNTSIDGQAKGILIVENGDFRWEGGGVRPIRGGVIVQGGAVQDGEISSGTDDMCIYGPVISDGNMGNASYPLQSGTTFSNLPESEFIQLPGFGGSSSAGIQPQGWREVYN